MGKKKKRDDEKVLAKLLLITAILELTNAVLDFLIKLLDK